MAFLSPRAGDFVFETTNTAGTFNPFTLLGPVTVGSFTYSKVSEIYADGETLYYVRSQAVSAGIRAIFESGRGTYSLGSNTITPTAGSNSSNMAAGSSTFVPITWGAGSQNVICVPDAASLLTVETLIAVVGLNAAAIRAALSLGTAALLNSGVANGTIPVLADDGAGSPGLPAVSGRLLTGMPSSPIPTGGVFQIPVYSNAASFTGWTRIVSIDDCVMALTNNSGTTGGGPHAGGTVGGIGWDASFGIAIANHTLTISEIPHTNTAGPGFGIFAVDAANTPTGHSHGISSAQTWRPPTAYFSLYSKD